MICISRQVNSYAVFGKPGSSNIFFNYRNLQAYIRTGVHFWRWNPSQQCQIWEQQIKCILRQVCNRLIKNLVKNDRLLISTLISIRYVIGKTCKSNIFLNYGIRAYIWTKVLFWWWNPSQQCQIWEQRMKCISRQVCNCLIKNLVKKSRQTW